MRRRTLLALPAFLSQPARARSGFVPTEQGIALLRGGGLNLYLRHAITDRSQSDTGRRGDRAAQRNLSAAGRAQAAALGEAFRRHGITVAEVLSSEVFRARDTAELAFGGARIVPSLIADDYTSGDARADAAEVSRLLGQTVSGGNRVLVGHIVPMGMILGRSLAQEEFPEGAIGLFRPSGADWRFLGFLAAGQLTGN
ncbi:histidine phosphatase family protein [Sabulicella glaciei]|uniref:Histidine phosphatase family protein n=1 Tax=Sabulicella glaciei TaxID=2984948 RepID=A0ABT3P0P4_9PROT|nr:histidine phosphatase family protein [Roseococcus sp. MDT2-1-1]MCW8087985.1 histidine phosphatase family protein [Roseococcus sp. MDT2-1-1]